MPDDSQGAGAPQDTEQQSAEGQQPGAGATETQTQTQQETPKPQQDSANKLIKDFVAERGITVEDLLKQITDQEDAQKSDLEKLTGERDDFKTRYETLEAKYRASIAESAVKDAATAAGAISAKAVFALIRDDVTYDDDGQPENVAALIEKAQTDEPALFRKAAGRGDGGKGNGHVESSDMNALIRRAAGRT